MLLAHLVEDAQRLTKDLAQLKADLELQQNCGYEVLYAPDFAELFAYSDPIATQDEFRIFSDDNREERLQTQLRALNAIFFTSGSTRLLLTPYRMELAEWLRKEKSDDISEAANLAKSALSSYRQLLQRPRVLRIMAMAARFDALSDYDKRDVIDYLEREGAEIISLFSASAGASLARIKSIFDAGNLIDDKHPIESSPEAGRLAGYDIDTFSIWMSQLEAERPSAPKKSIANDAAAVARVAYLNRFSEQTKKVVRIITRSSSMRRVAEKLTDQCGDAFGNAIRHTRVFSLLEGFGSQSISEMLSRVELAADQADLFIRAVGERASTEDGSGVQEGRGARDYLESEIGEIKALWHQGSSLATTLSIAEVVKGGGVGRLGSSTIETLTRSIASREAFRSTLVERVFSLVEGLETRYHQLGLLLQASKEPEHVGDLRVRDGKDFVAFESVSLHYPYHVVFRSSLVRRLALSVQSPEDLHAPVVGRRLSAPEYRGSSAEEFFEKLLVFAFCHAAYGNWSLGRRFAEVALEAIDRSSKIKLKEARILIAVCRSKSFSHDAKHHEVMDFFDQIVSVDSNSVRSLLQRGDARLVVELGSLAMRFPKAWSDWTGSSVNVSVDELGERAVDRAEHSKSGDLGLRLSALNNLCFWYASQGDERCLQYWDRLANFVDDVSVKHIWREVQHTLLYCESEFGEGVTDEERATLRNRLKKLEAQLGE